MSLRERLEQLVERVGGQRELSRRAGLKDERHVGVILGRLRKNPDADIERETLAALAAGGGVSIDWLANDKSRPETDAPALVLVAGDIATPHMVNALGFEESLAEARRRDETKPTAARIKPHGWAAVMRAGPYEIRGRVTPEDILKLAHVYEELADPARLEALVDDQARRIAELEAELARNLMEKPAASTQGASKKRGRSSA